MILTGNGAPAALNRLAREHAKLRLLADVRTDLVVCEIEGWDPNEYLRDLHALAASLDPLPGCPGLAGHEDDGPGVLL